ncbi:MAG: methylenetetrahydrofolate reductase [NAD(P)H] [bacterium]|nr:methylenetetrahydrofolate reductase [NAD(P)H] [bacterium]
MKVVEHLAKADKPLITFEIIPPLRGGDLKSLLTLIDDLVTYDPRYIDITSHAAEVMYEETPEGIRRRVKRKRPGTLGVCALIQNKYHIDAVPHLLCYSFTREETEDFLIELRYLGIDNVFAVRGDESGYRKRLEHGRTVNEHGVDLVHQICDMNDGKYLEEELLDADRSDFCIGTAGYPEKHVEAPNMTTDVRHLKEKVDAGADYIVTQMFFDNRYYFEFVEECRRQGIEVPIIPGLKVISSKRQLRLIPRTFHCNVPAELSEAVEGAKSEEVIEVGVEWSLRQVRELLDKEVPALHFFIMQSSKAINSLLPRLKL